MGSVILFPRHKLIRHENCRERYCPICEGGLAACETCGGCEGTLTTCCPQVRLSYETLQDVYAGKLDFTTKGWTYGQHFGSP